MLLRTNSQALPWKWSGFEGRYVATEDKLAHAMKTNPRLRVLVLTGRRDLAVPEGSMRYSIAHMQIPRKIRANVSFERFESGHMMYLYRPDAEKLRRNLTQFITGKPPSTRRFTARCWFSNDPVHSSR